MDKIEDAVPGRFESRDETRPGNRALWGCRSAKPAEMPLIAKPGEVRQGVPVALDKVRIHPVHAQHNQARALTSAVQKAAREERNAQRDRRRTCEIAGKAEAAAFY